MKKQVKILIIQTAFIGDAILMTALLEKLHTFHPQWKPDVLIRKGNEGLFSGHPFIQEVLVWEKRIGKYRNFVSVIKKIRSKKYEYVVNLQRFTSTGIITALSGGKDKRGFKKNPLSMFYTHRYSHDISKKGDAPLHETSRNQQLIADLTDGNATRPRLYPEKENMHKTAAYKTRPYICLAPASVWYTKQYPMEGWINFLQRTGSGYVVYLLGTGKDFMQCEKIKNSLPQIEIINLCGALNLLDTSSLMKDAVMNYVNDSAPLHIASAMNAPVTAIFCSTIPEFGFGPVSDVKHVIEAEKNLSCRPCGLHGKKQCPEGHFLCAKSIKPEQLLEPLKHL